MFLTLRQCARLYIDTLLPLNPFSKDMVGDNNNGGIVSTVAYVGVEIANTIGVLFNIK